MSLRAAVVFLEEIGRSAREAARWYAENPTMLYLPPGYEQLRGEALTVAEIGAILGWNNASPDGLNGKGIYACGKTTEVARRGGGRGLRFLLFPMSNNTF